MAECPHAAAIQFCPLYVAAHDAAISTLGCITTGDDGFVCEVAAGRWKYGEASARLYLAAPVLCGELQAAEREHEAREQRNRNLRLNGIR